MHCCGLNLGRILLGKLRLRINAKENSLQLLMHILLQMLWRRQFALQQHCSEPVLVWDGESTFMRQSDFEGAAPLSAGQGDVSAAMIYFTSQKRRDSADNHYRSSSSTPSAGYYARSKAADPWCDLNQQNKLEQLDHAVCPQLPLSPVPWEVAVGREWRRDKDNLDGRFPWVSHSFCLCCKGEQLWASTPKSPNPSEGSSRCGETLRKALLPFSNTMGTERLGLGRGGGAMRFQTWWSFCDKVIMLIIPRSFFPFAFELNTLPVSATAAFLNCQFGRIRCMFRLGELMNENIFLGSF